MTLQLDRDSTLLRIFIGELDKLDHRPLYEALVYAAKEHGIAGVTVLRGIMGFGASSRIHTAKLLDISFDLPVVVEIVDTDTKVSDYLEKANQMIEATGCGAMVTAEKVEVIHYYSKKHITDA